MFRLQTFPHRGCRCTALVLVAALALLVASPAATAAAAAPDSAADATTSDSVAHEAAMAAYERNHWAAAYQALAGLADRGHADAARMVLQMRRYGPALYGQPFAASDGQLERWSRLSGCGGTFADRACRLAAQAR